MVCRSGPTQRPPNQPQLRAVFYVVDVASRDEDVQRRGLVMIKQCMVEEDSIAARAAKNGNRGGEDSSRAGKASHHAHDAPALSSTSSSIMIDKTLMIQIDGFLRFAAPVRLASVHVVSNSMDVLDAVTPVLGRAASLGGLLRMVVHCPHHPSSSPPARHQHQRGQVAVAKSGGEEPGARGMCVCMRFGVA